MFYQTVRFVPYYKAFFLGLLLTGSVFAGEIAFPDTVTLEAKTLQRNGTGLRKATVFKIRVYAAALYVQNKSSDADSILASNTPKQMDLHFLRGVDQSSISDAWQESFQKACDPNCAPFTENLSKLRSAMTDVKEGDRQTYQFHSKGVTYLLNGAKKLSIEDAAFARVLLATWIGKHPPTEALRDGLLGKSQD